MTKIKFRTDVSDDAVKYTFECTGHCEHDVCVSISALVSTLVQIVRDEYNLLSTIGEPQITYESGNVRFAVDFQKSTYYQRTKYALATLETGFMLFESNYPEEISIE